MMHKSGRNDAVNPGASTDKTLGDYIARKSDISGAGPYDPKTLADYLERKGFFKSAPPNDDARMPKKKLTFEEWKSICWPYYPVGCDILVECWKAAQENV